jgi:predicted AlkP superfamily pyrophosphatase or phosphodiesterase
VLLSDNGAVMSLWFGADSSRLRRAQSALNATMAHAHAYLRSDAPARWAVRDQPRYGDLVLVADEGWILERRSTDAPPHAGNHGYDPELPSMHAIFVAAGPNVRRTGLTDPVSNVDVYPFLAAILRLEKVPKVDGSISALGRFVQ